MVPPVTVASALARNSRVAVLQPFLRRAAVRRKPHQSTPSPSHPSPSSSLKEASKKLDEAIALVDTLGGEVVLEEVVPIRSVHPKFLFGTGKVTELSGMVSASNADAVFVNALLSRDQQKALTDSWSGATVVDRFRVILDIFADRARTKEAKLQVELAGLKYEASRLVATGTGRLNSGYDRQGGVRGAMGGAGEKALEVRRRLLRDRMAEVKKSLVEVQKRRAVQRRGRDRRGEPTVALVGYTNVGKSTLLNRLSLGRGGGKAVRGGGSLSELKGAVHARDRVFDTLDPTSRSVTLPSLARCVVVDTVGFIQDLPTPLVHSFRATLEEVLSADLLLHVRDASLGPRASEAQRLAVETTLRELGAANVPMLEVWNKSDKEVEADEEEENADDRSHDHQGIDADRAERCRTEAAAALDATDSDEGSQAAEAETDRESATPNAARGRQDDRVEVHATTMPITRARATPKRAVENQPVRISASTGEGIPQLLGRLDALLNLGDSMRLTPPLADRYRYVRVLPGQQMR